MAGFEWTGPFKSRSYLYHYVGSMDATVAATEKVARTVETRAIANLAEQHHHIRIVPHTPYRIEVTQGGGKYPAGSWDISLVGDNPAALEYGHSPSGAFAGTPTKAPAGTYILHRAADLPAKLTHPRMGADFRRQTGRD